MHGADDLGGDAHGAGERAVAQLQDGRVGLVAGHPPGAEALQRQLVLEGGEGVGVAGLPGQRPPVGLADLGRGPAVGQHLEQQAAEPLVGLGPRRPARGGARRRPVQVPGPAPAAHGIDQLLEEPGRHQAGQLRAHGVGVQPHVVGQHRHRHRLGGGQHRLEQGVTGRIAEGTGLLAVHGPTLGDLFTIKPFV